MIYVVTSRNNYETLGEKTFSNDGPICSWESQIKNGPKIIEVRALVVYDSLKGRADPGAEGGVVRFLQGGDDGNGLHGNEMITGRVKRPEFQWWRGYQTRGALKEYGNTNVYVKWGKRECGTFDNQIKRVSIEDVDKINKENRKLKKTCSEKIFTIRCDISIENGGELNGGGENKPTVTYSAFYF